MSNTTMTEWLRQRLANGPMKLSTVKQEAEARGYVETLFGRRRYIPEIRSTNFAVERAGEGPLPPPMLTPVPANRVRVPSASKR